MITRRLFVGAMAGACVSGERLVLEAIAAEVMPHRLVVSGVMQAPFFELRDYGSPSVRMTEILCRHQIRPALQEGGRFLFPFDSLAARERTWREISADPDWITLPVQLREIAIYKASS